MRVPVPVRRRAVLLSAASALACSRSGKVTVDDSVAPPPTQARVIEWDLGAQPWGAGRAAIVVPAWGDPSTRYPVLVALHGRGESLKSPAEGALGWPRDYAMLRALDRLRAPPLSEVDYEGFVDRARLNEANASLVRQPLRGVIVACPWLPDLNPSRQSEIGTYARFVLEVLLPRVRKETPAIDASEGTGIDGVSLGGAVALRIGLMFSSAFGAVSGIQPAIAQNQTDELTALARAARGRNAGLRLRLLTSHDDYFRDAIESLSRAWLAAGVGHDFAEVVGPHDYSFNRGPGSIELLMWNDRALARS